MLLSTGLQLLYSKPFSIQRLHASANRRNPSQSVNSETSSPVTASATVNGRGPDANAPPRFIDVN
ncbi:MAG: hypothetical protein ACHQKY_00990 [Terriglobia bacterium]